MKIVRFCGKERLPGGERLWRRLAKEAGFNGTVKVYGYGAAGSKMATSTHRAYEVGKTSYTIVGLQTEKIELIEVWLPCKCQTAMDDMLPVNGMPEWLKDNYEPLFVFAHELGHYQQEVQGMEFSEPGATKRGTHLLEKVCLPKR